MKRMEPPGTNYANQKQTNMNKFHLISSALFLSLLIACNSCTQTPKNPEKDNTTLKQEVTTPTFNADSAYWYTKKQVDFGPRVNNSKAHIACGDWMIAFLKENADTVYVQNCALKGYDGKILISRNIIASFNINNPQRIALASHWDTRPWADQDTVRKKEPIDGANDGASGVGVLLEIARVLHENKLGTGIDLILLDAEDYGQPDDIAPPNEDSYCLGTQYWCKNPHVKGYKAEFGILLDMVGAPFATFTKEGMSVRYASPYLDYVWNIANEQGFGLYFRNDVTAGIIDDHKYINEMTGIPMIDIIDRTSSTPSGFGAYWHTHQDNMLMVDKKTLKAVGQTLLYTIYRFDANKGI